MATIGSTYPNLIDMYKNDHAGPIIEILNRQNPILDDAIATECNMGATHRHSIRTGLPTVSWGRLYQGVPQSKATVQQVDDTTGMLEAYSSIDKRLLALSSDPARQRLIDSAPFMESMNQEMASTVFYGDTATTPEKFKGLSARYNVRGGTGIGQQVVHGGGSGSDNTSIWFVTWGDHATSLLYPKGSKAGVSMEDKGEQKTLDASNNPFFTKDAMYNWHVGLAVKDWRYNARIANIDVSDIASTDIWDLMRKAYYKLQSRRRDHIGSRIAIYMNRDVLEVLDRQSSDRALVSSGTNYTSIKQENIEGKTVLTYRGIPIRETDAILNTEATVAAA
jgi:hypothetical protein